MRLVFSRLAKHAKAEFLIRNSSLIKGVAVGLRLSLKMKKNRATVCIPKKCIFAADFFNP
jgi:hypothetical protein